MIKLILLLAATLPIMSGAIITADLPMIAKHFAPNPDASFLAKMMITVPALSVVLFGPVAGWLVDHWGRRPVMLVGLLDFILAGSTGTWLDHPYALLIGRSFLGLGVACVMTSGTALIGDFFADDERKSFISRQGATMAFGGVIFVPLGGLLADIHWRLSFYIYLVPTLLLAMAWRYLLPIVKTHIHDAATTPTDPIPYGKQVGLIYVATFVATCMFYLIPVQLPFILAQRIGASGSEIGLTLGFSMVFATLAGMNHKKLVRWFRYPNIQLISYALTALGFVFLQEARTLPQVLMIMVPVGLGYGLVIPNSNLWIIELVPFQVRGRVLGGLTSAIFLGYFISPFLVRSYPTSWGIYSFSSMILVGAILVLSIISMFFLKPAVPQNG